ncbi:transglutaminase family protein [Rufibacter immobilis]|uniref:Transglutaminase family protein n=1 Tax=Rufibacter immobilis TaxID=1348778 RepID=A0A3M9MNQ2_9BACT|nr:transglutaminase family protein [Rufibacter immobilis]RNI27156.1 transglutaminase family protein [Rufibacter immobilis]
MKTEYEVKYYTHNTYEDPVKEAFFSFQITPCQDDTQRVLSVEFQHTLPAQEFHHQNPFGFDVTSLYTAQPFREFRFEMTALVEKTRPFLPTGTPLTVAEEQRALCAYDFFIDHHLYLGTGHYTHIEDGLRRRLLFREEKQPVYDYLVQLNRFIHQMLEFDPEPTHVHTTVSEVIQLGRGVCQDYTHLFIGIARLNKIPCRYASGYLNQGLNLTGTAVMHAWAEAFVPGLGWQGFDPTNNLLADLNFIKAAHGADYGDCSPLRGVLKTTGGHKTAYGVTIHPTPMVGAAQQ